MNHVEIETLVDDLREANGQEVVLDIQIGELTYELGRIVRVNPPEVELVELLRYLADGIEEVGAG